MGVGIVTRSPRFLSQSSRGEIVGVGTMECRTKSRALIGSGLGSNRNLGSSRTTLQWFSRRGDGVC